MATIDEVKAAFEEQLQTIYVLDQSLGAERAELLRRAFKEGRALSDQEVKRRKEIASTRQELADALRILGLETVGALESASDVDSLLAEIEAINLQLKDDLDHLHNIAKYAGKVAKFASGMALVLEKLQKLRPTLV